MVQDIFGDTQATLCTEIYPVHSLFDFFCFFNIQYALFLVEKKDHTVFFPTAKDRTVYVC